MCERLSNLYEYKNKFFKSLFNFKESLLKIRDKLFKLLQIWKLLMINLKIFKMRINDKIEII